MKDKQQSTQDTQAEDSGAGGAADPSRRGFLGKIGVGAAIGAVPFAGAAHAMDLGDFGLFSALDGDADPPSDAGGSGGSRSPAEKRRAKSLQIRIKAAQREAELAQYDHANNGDEDRYESRIGNFGKTLPHDPKTGEVDRRAYDMMLKALNNESYEEIEQVPRTAASQGRFFNPLGGLAYNIEGPDSAALPMKYMPFPIASAGKAAEMVESYWLALLRDVPFADYDTNPLVAQACADLSRLSAYDGPRDANGKVTPQLLFRFPYKDTDKGPIISQFLLQDFAYDAIPISPRINTRRPVVLWRPDGTFEYSSGAEAGFDYQTGFAEHVTRSNSEPSTGDAYQTRFDPKLRFPRSARDLAHIAGNDQSYSVYFRALYIIYANNFNAGLGNAYKTSRRQFGFSTHGLGDFAALLAAASKGVRHAWYHKWFVHRHLRPEEYGRLIDRHVRGIAKYPLPSDVLDSPALPLIAEHNRKVNKLRGLGDEAAYLLPQQYNPGAPLMPAAPSGHAFTAGASVTMLKAFVDLAAPFPATFVPVQPSRDGSPDGKLPPYTGGDLTILGELNKLAHNIAFGRDMAGVHWRVSDDYNAMIMGEELAIRILQEAKATYPEAHGSFTIVKFDGTTVKI